MQSERIPYATYLGDRYVFTTDRLARVCRIACNAHGELRKNADILISMLADDMDSTLGGISFGINELRQYVKDSDGSLALEGFVVYSESNYIQQTGLMFVTKQIESATQLFWHYSIEGASNALPFLMDKGHLVNNLNYNGALCRMVFEKSLKLLCTICFGPGIGESFILGEVIKILSGSQEYSLDGMLHALGGDVLEGLSNDSMNNGVNLDVDNADDSESEEYSIEGMLNKLGVNLHNKVKSTNEISEEYLENLNPKTENDSENSLEHKLGVNVRL